MKNPFYIEEIKKLGFTEYEAKCYLALFEKDSMTVPELARIAGIPKPNAYQTMENLLAKGLCISLPDKIKKYSAIDPQFVREKLFESFTNSMKTFDCMVNDLNVLYKKNRNNNNPLDYIEILKNPNQIHRKFISFLDKVQNEIVAFTKPPFTFNSQEQRKEQLEAQFAAYDRNVTLRNIVQMPADELVTAFSKDGVMFTDDAVKGRKRDQNTKFIEELPMKLYVFDERICFFALEDPIKTKTSLTMLIAEHEAMAKSFKLLFETIWEKANDYFVVDNKRYYLYTMEENGEIGEKQQE